MKKILVVCFTAIIFTTGITSCTKSDAPQPDLTASIVGTYIGGYADTTAGTPSTSATNIAVIVTKIDNTHIQVTPPTGSPYIAFSATVTTGNNGYYITAQSGVYGNISYTGSQFGGSIPPPYSGGYNTTNNGLGFCLIAVNGGVAYNEIFAGTKQP